MRTSFSDNLAGLLALLVLFCAVDGREASPATQVFLPEPSNRIFEAGLREFSAEAYGETVEALISAFERAVGKRLGPSVHGRAALKVYSDSGAGLATPRPMVSAIITALERRGFERGRLMIVGLSIAKLRSAGFIPPLSEGGSTFESVPVLALETGSYYDPEWFYDSPLPARISSNQALDESSTGNLVASEADRKSYLAAPLMFDVDFWINLPACTDHPVLGVNGALVNATLWNSSNSQRFFRSPATGPAAVAEMAAVPELRAGMVFTMVSLQRYQFIGGPVFNSLYTVSEPRVWLGDNPVLIDALLRERIDRGRREAGFRMLPEDLRFLAYAQQLGLGSANVSLAEWVPVNAEVSDSR
ncbi:MAG TPA: DUF362 domain-containing protein [Opitutaceae bacterium]